MKDASVLLPTFVYVFAGMLVADFVSPERGSADMDFTFVMLVIGFVLLSIGFIKLAVSLKENEE